MSSISLCIPAFNAAKYLPRLLQSALKQKIPFDEIIVYDDASTDNTAEIAKQYGATVIYGKINKGCAHGKNIMALASKSSWLHFHDADDELLPNFTTVTKKWIDNPLCPDIVLLNFEYKDGVTHEILGYPNYNRAKLIENTEKFVIENKLMNFAILCKDKFNAIRGFNTDPDVLYNEDRAFYSKAIFNRLSFDYESEVTCINYRQNESMSNSNLLKCCWAHYHVSEYLRTYFGQMYYREIAACYWENATQSAACQDWTLVRKNIESARGLKSFAPPKEKTLFTKVCKLNPFAAFWLREKMIRLFKPYLRRG